MLTLNITHFLGGSINMSHVKLQLYHAGKILGNVCFARVDLHSKGFEEKEKVRPEL